MAKQSEAPVIRIASKQVLMGQSRESANGPAEARIAATIEAQRHDSADREHG